MGRPRPWLAALLSVVYPGLGHLYLREWLRSVLWIAISLGTVALVLPQDPASGASLGDPGSIVEASNEMTERASTVGKVVVTVVFVSCAFDAYSLGRSAASRHRREAAGETVRECPHCGRELDEDLEFCHWCTTRLDAPAES